MKTLRCMAYKQDGVFVAVCLDLSLAAQADTMKEATQKLDEQIHAFVEELNSEPKYAKQLLNDRSAPLSLWIKYYYIAMTISFSRRKEGRVFNEPCDVLA